LLSPEDIASLKAFGDYRRATFSRDVAAGAKGRPMALDLPRPATFNVIRLREDIRMGQRIDSAAIESWNSGAWEQLATVTSVGPRRLIRLEKPVAAQRLRLRVTASAADPIVSEFALFAEPA